MLDIAMKQSKENPFLKAFEETSLNVHFLVPFFPFTLTL